jgi:hypothetical protein
VEQSNNRQTELFWELLDNPADKSYSHVQNLRQLINEYPQSGLLQALLLYAGEDDNLNHAVVYTDPRLLYKLRNNADDLYAVTDDQLTETSSAGNYFHTNGEVSRAEDIFALPETFDETTGTPFTGATLEHEPAETAVATGHDTGPLTGEDGFKADEAEENTTATPDETVTAAEEETIPLPEHTLSSYQEEQPVADIKPEPQPEQEIPAEDIKPGPQFEQEIELPTPGFFIPQAETTDTGTYEAGGEDMYSKLYESYTEIFEHTPSGAIQPIDDEVYDEIVSIENINLSPHEFIAPTAEAPAAQQPVAEMKEPVWSFQAPLPAAKEEPANRSRKVDLNDEAEKLMLGNIAATDFFVFDRALSERIKAGDEVKEEPAPRGRRVAAKALKAAPAKKNTYERVTRYFDDTMPYSFMWWLDKTRKEHSGIYQPFVEFILDTTQEIERDVPDELQQQYYENIFELTSVDELERTTGTGPVKFDPRKKEDEIIERFIHEVPQIKPQTGEKLDNENKARRSSEDQDEIVTETLAQVYVDQMLYHKAIKVYKKLILKFPEKSRYFASQIDGLEKKIS